MLQTLGELKLANSSFARPVPLLLLAYLSYEGGRHGRGEIAKLFWPLELPSDELQGLASEIAERLYDELGRRVRASVTLPFPALAALPHDDISGLLGRAHRELAFSGWIRRAEVDRSRGVAVTYYLTDGLLLHASGTEPFKIRSQRLRSHVANLKQATPGLVQSTPKFLESAARLDVHELSEQLREGVPFKVVKKPFLEGVEDRLSAEGFTLGAELSTWIEERRREVASELAAYSVRGVREHDLGRGDVISPHISLSETAGRTSRLHLDATLTESGDPLDLPGRKYNPETYVTTPEEGVVTSFLRSDRHLLILVGASGSGKTNLLSHHYRETLQAGQATLFLNARLFTSPDLNDVLADTFMTPFSTLSALLAREQRELVVYVDAVNEYNNRGDPLMLLSSLSRNATSSSSRIKVIASCRTETWRTYVEAFGSAQPFDAEVLTMQRFGGEQRERLYRNYQAYYDLRPRRYDLLGPGVQTLISNPFMMRVIAESYANSGRGREKHVPKSLNYYAVFRLLTDKKFADAQRIVAPNDPKAPLFPRALEHCLLAFAAMIFRKVTLAGHEDPASLYADTTDAITASDLYGSDVAEYLDTFSEKTTASVFGTAVDLGLIEETSVAETNLWGRSRQVKAFKFFHDQYTQYWLSAVLHTSVLRAASSADLLANPARLEEVGGEVSRLLVENRQTPLVAGALEHWLYTNMFRERGPDFLTPLFDHLAAEGSGSIFYYIGTFLHGLVEKNELSAAELYKNLFFECSAALKLVLANHLAELWPDLTGRQLKAFLANLDNLEDKEIVRSLSDNFVELFGVDPGGVTSLLENNLKGGQDVIRVVGHALLNRVEAMTHATFVLNFGLKAAISHAVAPAKVWLLKGMFERKYRLLLDILISSEPRFAPVQRFLYQKLEEIGINQWDQAFSHHGGNNHFFVERRGVVQRDTAYAFYPFIVAFHNREFADLSFENETFKGLALSMMSYDAGSIMGYFAALIVAGVVSEGVVPLEEVVETLLDDGGEAALYSLNLILSGYAYMKPHQTLGILGAIVERVIPFLSDRGSPENVLGGVVSIAALDFTRLKGLCERGIELIVASVAETGDRARAAHLAEAFTDCVFHPNVEASVFLMEYALRHDWLYHPTLRPSALGIFSAMFVRNPTILTRRIAPLPEYEDILKEVKQVVSLELLFRRDSVSYQTVWNRFIGISFTNTRIRYYFLKVLTGSILQCNCVPEYAKEFRRFIIELARGMFTETGLDYNHFTMEEAMRETESEHVPGTGQPWVTKLGEGVRT